MKPTDRSSTGWRRVRVVVETTAAVSLHAAPVLFVFAILSTLLVESLYPGETWSLEAWSNVISDSERWGSLIENTAVATGICLAGLAVVGTPLAGVIFKTNAAGSGLACALLVVAASLPIHVTGASLVAPGGPTIPSRSPVELGLAHGVAHLPIFVLLVGSALLRVPRALEEAAMTDGCSPWRTLWTVTLPNARSGFVIAGLLAGIWMSTDHAISDLLLVRTFAEEVSTQFQTAARAAEPTVLAVPQTIVLGALLWMLSRHVTPTADDPLRAGGLRWSLGRWRGPVSLISILACTTLIGWPLARLLASLPEGRGLAYYAAVFRPELETSVPTSFAAGAICAMLAAGLAWRVCRGGKPRIVLGLWLATSLATSAPVLGFGLVRVANRWLGPLYDSPAILTTVFVLRFLPIAVLLLVPVVRTIPQDLEHAARGDGSSDARILWHVIHPLAARGTVIAFVVVTILSLGELSASLLVTPPGHMTISQAFASKIHYGLVGEAAGLCLLALVCIAPLAIVLALLPWPRRDVRS